MSFGAVDPSLDLVALEVRVLDRWRDRDIVGEVARSRKGAEPWIFYEGPPTANGKPGLHHVWARVFKDVYPRFQTMRSEEHTSELQSLMRISYAVFCLKKKNNHQPIHLH